MTGASSPFSKQMNVSAINNTPTNTNLITEDQIKEALPQNMRIHVTPSLVQDLNTLSSDPLYAESIKDNFISYSAVLKDGKFKIEDYVNAIKYVSYKIMGYNNEDSYARTFPSRYQQLVAQGKSKKDISSYVSMYSKGKLVNLITEMAMIPVWLINAENYQKAINTQIELMMNANSELVRQKAADSILTHLKKPEKHEFQINMDIKDNAGILEMKSMLMDLAEKQSKAINEDKIKTIDVASSRIISEEKKDG